jgi:hypothetical protein
VTGKCRAANRASRNRERVGSSGLHQVERSDVLKRWPSFCETVLKVYLQSVSYSTVAKEQIAETPLFSETRLSGRRIYKQRAVFSDTVLHCP